MRGAKGMKVGKGRWSIKAAAPHQLTEASELADKRELPGLASEVGLPGQSHGESSKLLPKGDALPE